MKGPDLERDFASAIYEAFTDLATADSLVRKMSNEKRRFLLSPYSEAWGYVLFVMEAITRHLSAYLPPDEDDEGDEDAGR